MTKSHPNGTKLWHNRYTYIGNALFTPMIMVGIPLMECQGPKKKSKPQRLQLPDQQPETHSSNAYHLTSGGKTMPVKIGSPSPTF